MIETRVGSKKPRPSLDRKSSSPFVVISSTPTVKAVSGRTKFSRFFGGDVGGVIPDPIPNSEVKPSKADGTAREAAWESRTLPGLI